MAINFNQLQKLDNNTLLGNNSGAGSAPSQLSISQIKTLLALSTSDISGLTAYIASSSISASQVTGLGTLATASSVTLPNIVSIANNTLLGNNSGSSASPTALSISNVQTLLGLGSIAYLSTIPNTSLTNSSITVNGSSIALGGSATVKASTTNVLTLGTGLTGTSFDGSSAVTAAVDTSVVTTLTGTQTLSNKTLTIPYIGSAGMYFSSNTGGNINVVASSTNSTPTLTLPAITGTLATTTGSTFGSGSIWNGNVIGTGYGGTGLTGTPSNGQILIGNGTGYTLATITAGTNIRIDNSVAGAITITSNGIYENPNTISSSYTIVGTNNAVSIGDITISGASTTLTLATNSQWKII